MKIPKKITLYCRQKDNEGVYHVFPVDAESNHDSARTWAQITGARRYERGKPIIPEGTPEPKSVELDNRGFDNLTITNLQKRGQGGRAYQVVMEEGGNKYRFDLREDTLMDVIHTQGIQAGGRLNGTFCFAKVGTSTKIILEGTKDHIEALEDENTKTVYAKPIKKADLKVGSIYAQTNGREGLFVGHVYTADINPETGELGKTYKAMVFIEKVLEELEYVHDVLNTPNLEVTRNFARRYGDYAKAVRAHNYKVDTGKAVGGVDVETYLQNIRNLGGYMYDWSIDSYWTEQGKWGSKYRAEDATNRYKMSTIVTTKSELEMNRDEITLLFNLKGQYSS